MSGTSSIEWTEATWNPVTGCDRVSPGCAHCYALTLAARLKRMGQPRYQRDGGKASGPGFGVTLHEDKLEEPLRWRKPRVVFVNSMSDLFHEAIPDEFIAAVFGVMAAAEQHTFQVLTKRPDRMRAWFDWHADQVAARDLRWDPWRVCEDEARELVEDIPATGMAKPWPLPNVWLGVTIENRRFVHRADLLRETPAAVRFVSAEPLLGPLVHDTDIGMFNDCSHGECSCPKREGDPYTTCWSDAYDGPDLDLTDVDWLICGGESGPHARPMDPEWARDLRDACATSGTAFFFKQWGGRTPKAGGRDLDGRTWDEMPAGAAARGAVPSRQEVLA